MYDNDLVMKMHGSTTTRETLDDSYDSYEWTSQLYESIQVVSIGHSCDIHLLGRLPLVLPIVNQTAANLRQRMIRFSCKRKRFTLLQLMTVDKCSQRSDL